MISALLVGLVALLLIQTTGADVTFSQGVVVLEIGGKRHRYDLTSSFVWVTSDLPEFQGATLPTGELACDGKLRLRDVNVTVNDVGVKLLYQVSSTVWDEDQWSELPLLETENTVFSSSVDIDVLSLPGRCAHGAGAHRLTLAFVADSGSMSKVSTAKFSCAKAENPECGRCTTSQQCLRSQRCDALSKTCIDPGISGAGAGERQGDSGSGSQCKVDDDCRELMSGADDKICLAGKCVQLQCRKSDDCGEDFSCVRGRCVVLQLLNSMLCKRTDPKSCGDPIEAKCERPRSLDSSLMAPPSEVYGNCARLCTTSGRCVLERDTCDPVPGFCVRTSKCQCDGLQQACDRTSLGPGLEYCALKCSLPSSACADDEVCDKNHLCIPAIAANFRNGTSALLGGGGGGDDDDLSGGLSSAAIAVISVVAVVLLLTTFAVVCVCVVRGRSASSGDERTLSASYRRDELQHRARNGSVQSRRTSSHRYQRAGNRSRAQSRNSTRGHLY